VRVFFCGVRGSTPAPGPDFVRYGGHTSCVAVAHDGQPPTLVLDAGTGLRNLDRLLDGQPFRGSLLLGHLHWDHTHGLPFWRGGSRPDTRADLYLPEQGGADVERVLARAISPPHFPVEPHVLGPGLSFSPLKEGWHELEGFSVLARDIPHKGGHTMGLRVSDGRSTLAYLSDHSQAAYADERAYPDSLLELVGGVDLLLHDAQHVAAEWPAAGYLGHATVDYAVALARSAGVRRLGLFHHSPDRTDDEIDVILAPLDPSRVFAAAEGMVVDL